jgi:hypothetical protein
VFKCNVGQSLVFIYIHILVNVHGKGSDVDFMLCMLLTLMLSIFGLCNLVIKEKIFCFVETDDRYGFCKRMVSYKETLRNSLTVNQSKFYFPHPLTVRRQLLANRYPTFHMNFK